MSDPRTRVLIVEDDVALRHLMVHCLEDQNMRVVTACDGQEVMWHFAAREPSLVILDLELGRCDGLNLLSTIRSRSDVPVIVAAGRTCDGTGDVRGLELGADHYVTKPFGLRELLARVRAVLRRHHIRPAQPRGSAAPGAFRFGGWKLDQRRRHLVDPAGAEVILTKGECALLIAFLQAPGRLLTREHLLQATRVHEDVSDRSIDVGILRLRRKMHVHADAHQVIRAERGLGYRLVLPVERAEPSHTGVASGPIVGPSPTLAIPQWG
jgi:two-component system, OmpR family, response regulator